MSYGVTGMEYIGEGIRKWKGIKVVEKVLLVLKRWIRLSAASQIGEYLRGHVVSLQ